VLVHRDEVAMLVERGLPSTPPPAPSAEAA
jgi:hypothetical protein